jgi:hypothetical protein
MENVLFKESGNVSVITYNGLKWNIKCELLEDRNDFLFISAHIAHIKPLPITDTGSMFIEFSFIESHCFP